MRVLFALIFAVLPLVLHAGECPEYLNTDLRRLHSSESVNLCDVAGGKPMLVVNTASYCGFTGQFEGLERLHQEYQSQGLVVLGFASDDFNQEADSEAEAASVCYKNFGVTFTMIAPTSVRGEAANPVFRALNQQSGEPGWNFSKYVVDASGKVTAKFPSRVTPEDPRLLDALNQVVSGGES